MIARGFEYATAREWALKLKELGQVFADPYSAADFQHGPLALVEPGVPVLAVARAGAPEADLVALLGRLRTDLDAALMVLSDHPRHWRPRPGRSGCRTGRPSGSGRSCRSWPGSSTRCT